MKLLIAAFAVSAALVTPALAQDYSNGPVWDFADIQTKDGHFDDYMHWLATDWKHQEEALKKAGVIVDYKVFLVDHPRQNEPDIVLGQEYPNMATFDTPVAKQYALTAQIAGSIAKSNQGQAARGAIRTIMGSVLTREAILK
jgi:hypothetical protein